MAKKPMKKAVLEAVRATQIETIMRFYHTSIRMSKINLTISNVGKDVK